MRVAPAGGLRACGVLLAAAVIAARCSSGTSLVDGAADASADLLSSDRAELGSVEVHDEGGKLDEVGRADGADAQPGPSDCLPACIADLRKSCRFPMMGDGSCIHEARADSLFCFSNGVREILYPSRDAGAGHDVMVTRADGVTPCYYEDLLGNAGTDFISPTGVRAGTVQTMTDGSATVTCADGTSTQLPASALSGPGSGCNGVTVAQCTEGTCP